MAVFLWGVMKLICIGVLGGLGCVTRYLLTLWTQHLAGRDFPYGTLLINVTGSFLLGLLLTMGVRQFPVSPDFRLGLSVGFLGGFTTFSTFSYQTLVMLEEGSYWSAGANILFNVILCLVGVFAGMLVARQLA
ncbi:MAG: fluoride efflux transporter CrcB [Pelovirga sp.]